jgi:SAM-dependent methyltransferase
MADTNTQQFRWTTIAHGNHHYLSPLSPDKAQRFLSDLSAGLTGADLVLDAGCGKAALLRDLLDLSPVRGVGIDLNRAFLDEASALWRAAHPADSRLDLHACPILDHVPPAEGYAAVLCVGSVHGFGSLAACLSTCYSWLRPGGCLLLADGYWKQPPAAAYLAAIDGHADEFSSHGQTLAHARASGYWVLRSATSSDEEWDDYEGTYCLTMMRYVAAHPDDDATPAYAERMQRWHQAYLDWGRATLGFGYYLLMKP